VRNPRTKKPPKRTAIQKRQAIAAEAREKFPNLLERLNELREKAKTAFEPRYTPQKLRSDIIKLAKKWRRSDKVEMRLGQTEKLVRTFAPTTCKQICSFGQCNLPEFRRSTD
jgi:hypothetical protein